MKTMVEEQQIAINSLINRVNKLEKQGKGRLFLLCYEIRQIPIGYQNRFRTAGTNEDIPDAAQQARSPKNVKKLKLDVIVIDTVYFSFICFWKLILYNSKPHNQMSD